METTMLRSYRLEFAKHAEWRRHDGERKLDAEKAKFQREKEEQRGREREAADDALMDMVVMVFATESELQSFAVEVDAYKPATIEALMENEEQMAAVRRELRLLLDQAYVLPDGRRVFKTEDGMRVFDERGSEVKNIDPDAIENWRPSWEKYQNPFTREADLVKQREDILEFQKLTDDIDVEVAEAEKNGGMTRERLDELRKKLADEAPEAVKSKMAKTGPEQNTDLASPKSDPAFRPAGKLDMPTF